MTGILSIMQTLAANAGDSLARRRANLERDRRHQVKAAASVASPFGQLQPFAVGARGNFPFYWQDPSDLTLNEKTYEWIASSIEPGPLPLRLGGSFSHLFEQAIRSVTYELSDGDQHSLSEAGKTISLTQQNLLLVWKSTFGRLPLAKGDSQPIDLVLETIATQWATPPLVPSALLEAPQLDKALNATPFSGAAVIPALRQYLDAIGRATSLASASSRSRADLRNALLAIQEPTEDNGGVKISNGRIRPGFQVVTPVEKILRELKDTSEEVVRTAFLMKRDGANPPAIQTENAVISAPSEEVLSLHTTSGRDLFNNTLLPEADDLKVEAFFPGLTFVEFGPLNFDPRGGGWFWPQPLRDAQNVGASAVSGFRFAAAPNIDFSTTGPFRYLTGVAISLNPVLRITLQGKQADALARSLISAGDIVPRFLGSPLGERYTAQATNGGSGVATLTVQSVSPQPGPTFNSTAYVLGARVVCPVG